MRKRIRAIGVVLALLLALAGLTQALSIQATSLSNVIVGGMWNTVAEIRFQAASSTLFQMRLYWILSNPVGHPGYAAGSGGSYTYTLNADNAGVPGAVLVTGQLVAQNPTVGATQGAFPLIGFPPNTLTPGRFYDVVITNVDPQPKLNWASLDFLYNAAVINQTPRFQVWRAPAGAPWKQLTDLAGSPIEAIYADGTVDGYGYYQVGGLAQPALLCGTNYGFPAILCQ